MTSQREQYGSTVHLFIDAGRSPRKITSMSITFVNGLWKSVEAPEASLRTASATLDLRLVQASSWPCSIFIILDPKIPVHIIHSESIVKSCF
jgi:hypothetical protein